MACLVSVLRLNPGPVVEYHAQKAIEGGYATQLFIFGRLNL
jgi:hypothetical protein